MRDLSLTMSSAEVSRKTKTNVSTYVLNLSILASIVIISLVYFFSTNTMGTKGYAIKKLEGQLTALEQTQKDLQLQISDLQSIDRIQTEATKLNFVPTTNVSYLKASDFALK